MKFTFKYTTMRICYIFLVMHFILFTDTYGSTHNNGLIFDASNNNSTLVLTGNDFTSLSAGFKIEFHFFIYPESKYGSLFKLYEKDEPLVDFSFYPMPRNGGRLTLRLEDTGQLLTFDLNQHELSRNAWQRFELSYIPATQTILLKLNNKSKVIQEVYNFIQKNGSLHFGHSPAKSEAPFSSAHFAIKNLSIFSIDGRLKHFYPLEKNRRNKVIDLTGNQHLNVKNPQWVEDLHNRWTEDFKTYSNKATSGTFSAMNQETYLFTGEVLSVVSADNFQQKIIPVIKRLKSTSFHLILNEKRDQLYCFNSNWNELIYFDLTDFSQTFYSIKNNLPEANQTIGFYHTISKAPMVLIGSKDHTFSGYFYSLDLKHQVWKIIPLNEELLMDGPIAYHLSTNQRKLHVLSSTKNESPDLNKYNFLEIDLISFTHKTLAAFESSNILQDRGRLSKNLISPAHNHDFYLFQQVADSSFLIKLDATSSEMERIPVSFPDNNMAPQCLSFNPRTQELTCIAHGISTNQTGIYTINFPPATLLSNPNKISGSLIEKWIYVALICLLVYIIFLLIITTNRKRKLRELMKQPHEHVAHLQERDHVTPKKGITHTPPVTTSKPSSIELLGDYQLFNQNHKRVNESFTSFLEEFFLFLLISSVFNNGKGITSEEINQAFWPYHDAKSARNNRGVNISRLRRILAEIEGIELIFDKNQYQLIISESFDIDLQAFLTLAQSVRSKQDISSNELKNINQLINKGPLLNHLTTSWLDPYREQFELLLSQLLEVIVISAALKEQLNAVLNFCQLVLIHDKLNETALQLILFIHGNQQKKDLQRQVYQSFSRNYNEVMGESYNLTIKECISSIENQF